MFKKAGKWFADWYEEGKRKRKTFEKREEAKAYEEARKKAQRRSRSQHGSKSIGRRGSRKTRAAAC
ncbi:MAG TPA: hypothetical protein VGR81_08715 [Candidatus Acidoferrales bacterium]|nr:hypothetical protein [Candidatus Acidoferrales bacterium]